MTKTTLYSVKAGFLIALAGTLLMLLLLSLDLVGPQSVKNDNLMIGGTLLFISLYLFLLIGIYKSISNAKQAGDRLNFKKAFFIGLITSLATAFFSVLFTLLFYEWLYPDYTSDMTAVMTEKLADQNLSEAERAEKINEQIKYYSTAMQAQFAFVGNFITGAAFSLILSLFLKSKKSDL